jgi:hypothetical protein
MLVPLAKDCLPAEEASTTAEWEQAYDQWGRSRSNYRLLRPDLRISLKGYLPNDHIITELSAVN